MLTTAPWQMSYGERAAVEGVLGQLRPRLALEIGTAEGGSLRRIAAHSEHVHSFDLVPPSAELAGLANATFHTGDSHVLLPQVLEELAVAGKDVDFVLVDGDHSADGVRGDLDDLLSSQALRRTIVLLHDTMNPDVRRGIEDFNLAGDKRVAFFDLDFLPGYLARGDPYRLQLWGGLGLIVVDADRAAAQGGAISDDRFHSLFTLTCPMAELMAEIEARGTSLAELQGSALEDELRAEVVGRNAELVRSTQLVQRLEGSLSWRVTGPLRALKRYLLNRDGRARNEE
ncbi:MAG TPA: class I SAM-dependent methyltransferase [Solirubrobacteraceae bacterium]|nr:class I SAM-dependent methyltransferase [Solirubrobacteraceae bacterium]